MPSHLMPHNLRACRLGQATGSSHVLVTVTARKWYHNIIRGLLWEREWAMVIK